MRDIPFRNFSPELMLAIACARWPPDAATQQEIHRRATPKLDWERFLAWVVRHGIGPLARRNLEHAGGSIVPGPVLTELRTQHAHNARLVLLQIAEARRMTRLLGDAGIPSIILKGPVLSLLAFGEPALRASRDIDILVDPSQVRDADRLIIEAGYRRFAPDFELTPPQHALYQRLRCQFGYDSAGLPVIQELHWRLTSNIKLLPLDERVLWARRGPVRLGGTDFHTLPDEEMFLYLCVHGSMHVWFRLKWLADIAALLSHAPPDFVDVVAQRADSLGITRPLHQALALAHLLLDARVPQHILTKATRDGATPGLIAAACRALDWDQSPSEPGETRWFNLWVALQAYRLRPEPAYWWAEFQAQLCSPEDWARLPLPESLSFLYLPLRPISWAVRKLRQTVTP